MDIAIPIYDRFTALDAIGPYEVLSRLPGARVSFVADSPARPHRQRDARPRGDGRPRRRAAPDMIVVPGGVGTRELLERRATPGLDPRRARDATWTTSVCTGSLLLGAAGLLDGPRGDHALARARPLAGYGAGPPTSASSSRARSSPPPASPRASTWRCGSRAASPGTTSPGPAAHHRVRPPAPLRRGLDGEGRPGAHRAHPRARRCLPLSGRRPAERGGGATLGAPTRSAARSARSGARRGGPASRPPRPRPGWPRR